MSLTFAIFIFVVRGVEVIGGGSGRVVASAGLVGVLRVLGAGWSVVEPAGVV